MDIVQNIEKIAKNKGITLTEVERLCGFSKSSIRKWSENIPNIKKVITVCEVLDVSLDYLALGKSVTGISSDEQELIANYNSVDELSKALIRERAAVLAEMAAAKSNAVKIALKQSQTDDKIDEPDTEIEYIYLDMPELSVSAGTGEYLHSDYVDKLRVPATNLTRRADYALKVHGDSMEPRFHDGDIVLVAKAEVREGDIGIFILNGEGYIKEKGDKRLISLNNKYKDIKIGSGDTCICRGKVIGSL